MPALGIERELDKDLAALHPRSRYQDLAIWLRRLTIESPGPIPDDTLLQSADGVTLRVRTTEGAVIAASLPPGASAALQDGAALTWEGGQAQLRVEVVARFGGIWDHKESRFIPGEPKQPLIFDLQESQIAFTRWFAQRWRGMKGGSYHPKNCAMVVDDRGGGKTLIVLWCLLGATLDMPRWPDGAEFVPWIVSVNHPARREIDREIRRWLPRDWYVIKEHPLHLLHLINGGLIPLMSADDPEDLRQGRVDLPWLNEGAKLSSAALENMIGRTKDRLGFAVVASNPPTADCPRGEWVNEFAENARDAELEHKRNPTVWIRCNSRLNVLQDAEASEDVRAVLTMLNPDRAAADADGILRPVGSFAYRPPFARSKHVIPVVETEWAQRDITRAVTLRYAGRSYDWIMGADYQARPAMVSAAMKVYGTIEQPTILVWSSFWIEGDEDDLLTAISEDLEWTKAVCPGAGARFTRENTVTIGDPSATWQDGKHSGKDTVSVYKARGWRWLPPQAPKDPTKKPPHPPIHLRVGRMNALMAEGRFLIADNATNEPLIGSLKKCPTTRRGHVLIPKPGHESTHLPDAVGYAVWWTIPRYALPARRVVARSVKT